MTTPSDDDTQDLSPYRIESRREILSLLRSIGTRKQLIRMQANHGDSSAVTSILEVNDAADTVIIDCASNAVINQRLLEGGTISFETVLDSIRILFSAPRIESCIHDNLPALRIPLPSSVIRLQRREAYRIMAPVSKPVYCTIRVPQDDGEPTTVMMPLYNVSIGGIALVDEKKLIPHEGTEIYENCRIDLPGGSVVVALQLRNSQELTLSNGKNIRRLGFMFVNASNAVTAAIQRFITKLEREQNARAAGMG